MSDSKTANKSQRMNSQNGAAKGKEATEERLSALQSYDASDPLKSVIALLEKKVRNLDKRKTRNLQLKQMLDEGKELNEDQRNSATKVNEVISNIELIKEFSSLISDLRSDHHASAKNGKSCDVKTNSLDSATGGSCNEEVVKKILELQNNFKKVVECSEHLLSLKTADDKILQPHESEKVLKFIKLVMNPNNASDNSAKLKKITMSFVCLLSAEKKIINQDINVTYEEMSRLTKKIPFTLLQCKLTTDAARKKNADSKEVAVAPVLKKDTVIVTAEETVAKIVEVVPIVEEPREEAVAANESTDGWFTCSRGTPSDRKKEQRGKKNFQNKRRGNEELKHPVSFKPESNEKPKGSTQFIVRDITGNAKPRYRDWKSGDRAEGGFAARGRRPENPQNGEDAGERPAGEAYSRRSFNRADNKKEGEAGTERAFEPKRRFYPRRGGENGFAHEASNDVNGTRETNGHVENGAAPRRYYNNNRRGNRNAGDSRPVNSFQRRPEQHVEASA